MVKNRTSQEYTSLLSPRLQPLLLVPTRAPWNVSHPFKSIEIDLKGPPCSSGFSPNRWNFVDSRRCLPTMTSQCTLSPYFIRLITKIFLQDLKTRPALQNVPHNFLLFVLVHRSHTEVFAVCKQFSHWRFCYHHGPAGGLILSPANKTKQNSLLELFGQKCVMTFSDKNCLLAYVNFSCWLSTERSQSVSNSFQNWFYEGGENKP